MEELYQERFTQLHELYRLCLQLNIETDYAVFVYDSGHVNTLKFDLRYSKENWEHCLYEFSSRYSKEKYDCEESLKENLKQIKDFRNTIEDLINKPTTSYYKVTFDFGITQVSKTFDSEEDRQKWVDNAEKTVGKSVKGVTPIYETIERNREVF